MNSSAKYKLGLICLSILTIFINGTSFAQCLSGDCENGKGSYKISEGTTYEGHFKNGLPNGEGKLIRTKGGGYEGNFVNGLYSGFGKLSYANGDVYTGQFREGMYHGSGSLKKSDGTVQTGTFFNNNFDNGKPDQDPMPAMNFYSSTGFTSNAGIAWRFDSRNALVYAEGIPYSLNTGRKIVDTAAIQQNETLVDNLQNIVKGKKFDAYRLLKKGTDYVLLGGPQKGKSDKQYFEVYKVTADEKAEKLMRINVAYGSRAPLPITFSSDDRLVFLDGRIYSAGNSEGVYVAERPLNMGWYTFQCFSPGNDTLYNVYHDVDPYRTEFRYEYSKSVDDGIVVSKFDTKTGKQLNQKAYFSRRLNNFYKGYRLSAFDFNTGKALVYFDLFATYFHKSGNGYGFKKAAVVDINDLDYMLPLRNPDVTQAYFVQKAKEVSAGLQDYLSDKNAAIERKKQNMRLTDEDEGFVEQRKPLVDPSKRTSASTTVPAASTTNKDNEQHQRNMDEIQRSIERQQNRDYKKKKQ